jgi:hypothetical protein
VTPFGEPEWVGFRLTVAHLSRELGLTDLEQDWGIANGDGQRLEEFVRLLQPDVIVSAVGEEVVDLVLSSANERLVDDGAFDQDVVFGAIAALDRRHWSMRVEYWGSLQDVEDDYLEEAKEVFPIASLVRTWFEDQSA